MEELVLFLIVCAISGILALLKVLIFTGMSWFWVFVPIMIVLGLWFLNETGD